MGLRYGLLAALTLVLASALLWDRLHPTAPGRLADRGAPDPADLAVLVVGGTPGPEPAVPAPPAPPAPAGTPVSAPGASAAPQEAEYTVEPGDTLGRIASRTLGSSRRAAEIARYNGFDIETPIRVGQVLRLPPAAPATPGAATPPAAPTVARGPAPAPTRPAPAASTRRTHTVGKGDTFYGIARRVYGDGGRWRDIASANGLDPDGPLPVGRELRIP
ncbi:MAG TPA: LysM domain-containing protein [Planctomycetota bacterium]|nr:LysM domain-containing protein [Planctomycetota bacterium]